jgi:hypothetical protein
LAERDPCERGNSRADRPGIASTLPKIAVIMSDPEGHKPCMTQS